MKSYISRVIWIITVPFWVAIIVVAFVIWLIILPILLSPFYLIKDGNLKGLPREETIVILEIPLKLFALFTIKLS